MSASWESLSLLASEFTPILLSSSFLGLPYRILNINHKKQLLRGLWVDLRSIAFEAGGLGWSRASSRASKEPSIVFGSGTAERLGWLADEVAGLFFQISEICTKRIRIKSCVRTELSEH